MRIPFNLVARSIGTKKCSSFYYLCLVKITTVLFSIYLFLLSLAPNFGGHELLKLPAFVMHFMEHKKENKEITLFEFMRIHYLQGNVMDKDRDHDMKLPFKSEEACLPTGTIAFVPVSIPHFSFPSYVLVINEIPVTDISFESFQSLSNIWQPPKAA